MTAEKPREIAFAVLRQRETGREFTESILDKMLEGSSMQSADRGLAQEIVYGVVRWQATLDWLIKQKTHKPPGSATRILLQIGLYQLFWLDRIPAHAAINETVESARRGGYINQAGFVNAVLRGYARELEVTRRRLIELRREDLATGWSHPRWIVDRWSSRWGTDQTIELLKWNNTPAPTFARCNTLKTDPGSLLELWREEGVDYDFGRWDWIPENTVFRLKAHPPLSRLGSFRAGWFYVQDPSTLLAVKMLQPLPGQHILDVCAAPGGKTTFIAQCLNNDGGRILAEDSSPDRLDLLRENCQRLGITCVHPQLITEDAHSITKQSTKTPDSADDSAQIRKDPNFSPGAHPGAVFDTALIDAPCSNTGVLRRRVDLRWRLNRAELGRFHSLQLRLLARASGRVKPAGALVYSTCSLEPDENRLVIEEFCQNHPEFQVEEERSLLPFEAEVDGVQLDCGGSPESAMQSCFLKSRNASAAAGRQAP